MKDMKEFANSTTLLKHRREVKIGKSILKGFLGTSQSETLSIRSSLLTKTLKTSKFLLRFGFESLSSDLSREIEVRLVRSW
jgi:hypothetical protein